MINNIYEISLWEDDIIASTASVGQHFDENKVIVIGSNTMDAPYRAFEPQLTENINGTHSFTFKTFLTYRDEDNVIQQNPFSSLLINERKVKVKWQDKWYDFIIKDCQEDSKGKTITYTCTDLFVNELSKNGFSLEFDSELGDNQGTIFELAQKVVEDTDWQIIDDDPAHGVTVDGEEVISDSVRQFLEESVYEVLLTNAITNPFNDTENTATTITIPASKYILVFYSNINEQKTKLQFLYYSSQNGENSNWPTDTNSQLVIGVDCYSVDGVVFETTSTGYNIKKNGTTLFSITSSALVSSRYRGKRLVYSNKSVYDPLVEQYVDVYNNNTYYGYQKTEFRDPTVVNNLVINNSNFSSIDGWIGSSSSTIPELLAPLPLFTTWAASGGTLLNYKPRYLIQIKNGDIYNTALQESTSYISNGFQVGEKYIFRYQALNSSNGYISSGITPVICQYENSSDGSYKIRKSGGNTYFTINSSTTVTEIEDDITKIWVEFTLICNRSVTRTNLISDKVGLFLNSNSTYKIEKVQLFQYVEDSTGRINPGEMDKQSIAQIYYYYYNRANTRGLLSKDDIEYSYVGTEPWSEATHDTNENSPKIRSIEVKQSNRFNILQSLCETFECWVHFSIAHDSTGKIELDSDGYPKKYISFKNEVGEDNGLVFSYGIDLQSIQRKLISSDIVTKTIVSQNSNEYATNGFCSIARSTQNYNRDNFILNFDYFISQGLLDAGIINRDLYLSNSWSQGVTGLTSFDSKQLYFKGSTHEIAPEQFYDTPTPVTSATYYTLDALGYYYYLHTWNNEYDSITELYQTKHTELLKQQALQSTYENYISSIQEEQNELVYRIISLAAVASLAAAAAYVEENEDETAIASLLNTYYTNQKILSNYTSMLTNITSSITALQSQLTAQETRQELLINATKKLHYLFYKKYSRFIQEGSWVSDDYINDDLYYFDAVDVAYTSARPQITYSISVARLNCLEEFQSKTFKIGDISAIEDEEFFGYRYVDEFKTPYREKVIISEIKSNFDSPNKDTITVQNYKTQFEDLFQRITATTQSLQYSSGSYERAAAAVESDGTINQETLVSSIATNLELVYSAQNEAIYQDSTGITVTDATNPNKRTKVTSGGIFITTDGGVTWKNAVRGEGIATQYLTAGSINVENITILNGEFTHFRWDYSGINALSFSDTTGVSPRTFVRFDQYGIYGLDAPEDSSKFKPTSERDIWNSAYAKFGLLWNGFFLRNNDNSVEITSDNDIQVKASSIERIKIGRISGQGSAVDPYVYGIRINDSTGVPVIETGSDGKIWLKDSLYIGTTNTPSGSSTPYGVKIGKLNSSTTPGGATLQEVFNAYDQFIIWEDGSIKAMNGYFKGNGEFTGKIVASSGQIADLVISGSGLYYPNVANYQYKIDSGGIEFNLGNNQTFSLDTSGLELSLLNGKSIEFSTDGFAVTGAPSIIDNGEFIIQNSDDEQVLYFNPDTGKLSIQGTIKAEAGIIGDFIIKSDKLYSYGGSWTNVGTPASFVANTDYFVLSSTGKYELTSDTTPQSGTIYYTHTPYIQLLGTTGKIIAEYLTIGKNADIDDYLKVGDAFIYNPDKHNNLFLQSDTITLTDDGIFTLNNITMNGAESKIYGNLFSITPEEAVFNNIYAMGKIGCAVFETGNIQAVGGMFYFKESYKIKEYTTTNIKLETTNFIGNINDYAYLIDENNEKILVQISTINTINGYTYLTFTNNQRLQEKYLSGIQLVMIVIMGEDNDLIIGVNSQDEYSEYLYPRGFSFSKFNHDYTSTEPLMFLGDLSTIPGAQGYGLYSDNVFLRGSIVTNHNNICAGINTLTSIPNNLFDDPTMYQYKYCIQRVTGLTYYTLDDNGVYEPYTDDPFQPGYYYVADTSNIVFWGGAPCNFVTMSDSLIQSAPFQVTEQGSLYASQGLFEGALISNSIIQGTDVYTMRLHGGKNGEVEALTIYDTEKGIVFKTGYNTDELETFSIGNNGFSINRNFFIEINGDGTVSYSGTNCMIDEYYTNRKNDSFLRIKEGSITCFTEDTLATENLDLNDILDYDSEYLFSSDGFQLTRYLQVLRPTLNFTTNSIAFSLEQNTNKIYIDDASTRFDNKMHYFSDTIIYGNTMRYEHRSDGFYDLYITEE